MNDLPANPEKKISTADNQTLSVERTLCLPSKDEVQAEKYAAASDQPVENITPDKLRDLFVNAETTIRQKASAEIEQLEIQNQGLNLQNDRLEDENKRLRELHNTRKEYVGKLYWLIVMWLVIVVSFVALTATLKDFFTLSDNVLIAFITSTTISVIGLFIIVAKWLFPSVGDYHNKEK